MTLSEFKAQLETTGYRVAYEHFAEDDAPDMPFICYIETHTTNTAADGKVNDIVRNLQAQLFTHKKDIEAEQKTETALNEFYFSKECEFEDGEDCYRVVYSVQI